MKTENKSSFVKALCEALKKIEQPKHDSEVNYGKTKFSYASLKEVLERLKPLNEHGIFFTQNEVYEDGLWFMNTTVLGLLRLEKDSDGRYFWQPAATAGQPSTILGHGLAVFEDMADLATDSLSVMVGDMRAAYQIVDRIGIRMLRDPYTSKPNVLFYATKRTGGDLINGEALKIIKFVA